MWWFLAASVALAAPDSCERIDIGDVLAVPPPAIVVLGARHGTQPDLRRATKIVKTFAARAPTTVALEAVQGDKQKVLDDFSQGHVAAEHLPIKLDWDREWGFPYRPYQTLVTGNGIGVHVIAAGQPLGNAPKDAEFPVPGGYMSILRDAMADHEIPLPMQSAFIRAMAWRDYQIAKQAVDGWNHMGYLVVLAGRTHIEGGKGVPWQASLLTKEPVSSFVLDWGVDPPCYPGDQVWKPGLFERRSTSR